MSNIFSLDTLKNDLDHEFAPVQIEVGGETVTLRHVMRLQKAERGKALDAIEATRELDTNTADGIDEMLKQLKVVLGTVATGSGKVLTDAIGDDIALAMKVMDLWTERTQPGEASNSPA